MQNENDFAEISNELRRAGRLIEQKMDKFGTVALERSNDDPRKALHLVFQMMKDDDEMVEALIVVRVAEALETKFRKQGDHEHAAVVAQFFRRNIPAEFRRNHQ